MKGSTYGGWYLATLAFFAASTLGWSQAAPPDPGWNARMASLQEEQDAQTGVAVSIVFDDSGSMNDNHKLAMAKKAFRAWIEHAPDSYRFGLTALNAGELVPLQRNDRAQILAAVNALEADGNTPLARTIAQAGAEIRQRRAAGAVYERQVVVILTDGEDTTRRGIKGVQEEIRNLCKNRVEVIAFGYQGEGDYMKGSATHFYSPENGGDISKGLNAIGSEIGDTSDVVLDDATRAQMSSAPATVPASTAPDARSAATPVPSAANVPFSPDATPTPRSATVWTARPGIGFGGKFIIFMVVLALFRVFRRRRLP